MISKKEFFRVGNFTLDRTSVTNNSSVTLGNLSLAKVRKHRLCLVCHFYHRPFGLLASNFLEPPSAHEPRVEEAFETLVSLQLRNCIFRKNENIHMYIYPDVCKFIFT